MKAIIVCVLLSVAWCKADKNCCPPQTVLRYSNGSYHCFQNRTYVGNVVDFCSGRTFLLKAENGFVVDSNNDAIVIMPYRNATIPREQYCLARLNRNHTIITSLLVCKSEEKNEPFSAINDYCKVISAVFLLFTAILYASVKELRNTQGLSVINLCLSLGIALAILAGMSLPYEDMTLCGIRGFLSYFFLMASFFWMTSLTLQMFMKTRAQIKNEVSRQRFIIHFICAWGAAGLLTIIMAVLNYLPNVDHSVRAGIGLNRCGFFDFNQKMKYLYSVMLALVILNSYLFICTLNMMFLKKTEEGEAPRGSKVTKAACMFAVSGMTWLFEPIPESYRCTVTDILDLVNTLQGVTIFIVLGLSVLFYQKKYKWNIWKESIIKEDTVRTVPYKNLA